MKLGHLFTRIITLLMGGFKDRCEPDPRPQLYIPLCCVLDVPVALHLGGWLLVICWPPRPEQIGIIPLLGSWRAAVQLCGIILCGVSLREKLGWYHKSSPAGSSGPPDQFHWILNQDMEILKLNTCLTLHISISIYVQAEQSLCKANGPKCEKVALPK